MVTKTSTPVRSLGSFAPNGSITPDMRIVCLCDWVYSPSIQPTLMERVPNVCQDSDYTFFQKNIANYSITHNTVNNTVCGHLDVAGPFTRVNSIRVET